MSQQSFADRLKYLLASGGQKQRKAVSQAELAKTIGVTRQAISSYVNGVTSPPLDKFEAIADYFGVSYSYLLGKSDAQNDQNSGIVERLGLTEEVIDILSDMNKDVEAKRESLLSDGIDPNFLDIDIINRFIQYGAEYRLFDRLSAVCTFMSFRMASYQKRDNGKFNSEYYVEHEAEIQKIEKQAQEHNLVLLGEDNFIQYTLFVANESYKATLDDVLRPIRQPYLDFLDRDVSNGND